MYDMILIWVGINIKGNIRIASLLEVTILDFWKPVRPFICVFENSMGYLLNNVRKHSLPSSPKKKEWKNGRKKRRKRKRENKEEGKTKENRERERERERERDKMKGAKRKESKKKKKEKKKKDYSH